MIIIHLASGDRWGGAESQVLTLLQQQIADTSLIPILICLNPGDLSQRASELGVEVCIIDESEFSTLEIVKQLRALFLHYRPNMLHTHRQKENVLGSIANVSSVRCKSVRTQHGAAEYEFSLKQKLFDAADTFCGRHLQQAVIAVSAQLASALSASFGKRVVTIHNGLDADAVRQSALNPHNFGKGIHVGLVGRLEQVKRVDLFIEAATELAGDEFRFHIFGDGSLRVPLQHQAAADKRITVHGHRDDINTCIAGLDCLLMCSDHEGLPMTLLEAVALNTRVVARNMGGIAELLGGVAGTVLVKEHSAKAYADGVRKALELPAPKGELPAGFSAAENASTIKALYQRLSHSPAADSSGAK